MSSLEFLSTKCFIQQNLIKFLVICVWLSRNVIAEKEFKAKTTLKNPRIFSCFCLMNKKERRNEGRCEIGKEACNLLTTWLVYHAVLFKFVFSRFIVLICTKCPQMFMIFRFNAVYVYNEGNVENESHRRI